MGRWCTAVFGAVLALVATMMGASPASAAERSYLHLETGITADRTLVVHGALYTPSSQPIANQQVAVSLSNGPSGSGTTGTDGWFQVQLKLTSGPEQVVTMSARFAGTGDHEAVSQDQQLKLPADPNYTPATTAASTNGAALKLTATFHDENPQPGDAISVTGQLTDASGRAIEQGQITAEVNGQPGRSTSTDASGNYTAQAQIPTNQAPGKVAVVVKFAGGGGLAPAQTQVEVTVVAAESATPSSAEPASSSAAAPPPSDVQTEAPSTTPVPTLPPTPVPEHGLFGQWQVWAALGAIVVLAALAIWFGMRQHRRGHDRPFARDAAAGAPSAAETTDATGSWLLAPSATSPDSAPDERPEPSGPVPGPQTAAYARGRTPEPSDPGPNTPGPNTPGPSAPDSAPRHAQVDMFPPDIFSEQVRQSVGWANDANTRTATRMLPAQDGYGQEGSALARNDHEGTGPERAGQVGNDQEHRANHRGSRPARGIEPPNSTGEAPDDRPRRARRGL